MISALPIIERRETVVTSEAYDSVEESRPLIVDADGDWFVLTCEAIQDSRYARATLRLAIPAGGFKPWTLAKLNGAYGVEP